jgi:hypothetical protein
MNDILAVTPYTGSEKLVAMTARMLQETFLSWPFAQIVAVANKPSRLLNKDELPGHAMQIQLATNEGFGPGVNAAIRFLNWKGDLLVLNNDLSFPQRGWVQHLRDEQARDDQDNLTYVYAPRTNCTATPEACKDGSEDKPAQRVREISAYCWLVPAKVLRALRERGRFELFPPEFPNYGSDNAAAAWLRFLFGKTPFKVVHRAFVKHAKGQTAKETGDRPGDPKVLKRLAQYMRSEGLT